MKQSRVLGARELRGVLLPVADRYLLVPSVAVAEVIGYQDPDPVASAPQWLLGRLNWRGSTIPVVSIARALGREATERGAQRARIAVINTIGGGRLPYIGLLTRGISRLARVNASSLGEDPGGAPDSPLILEAIVLNEQPAWIPDLDELERMVGELDLETDA